MIRNKLLILLVSIFTLQASASFDPEIVAKANKFLEQKRRNRQLRALLYPGVHPEKKAITGEQYLQKKQERLLKLYHQKSVDAQKSAGWQTVACLLSGGLAMSGQSAGTIAGAVVAALGFGWAACHNFNYAALYTSKTEEKKHEVLGRILDEKIDEVKSEINYKKSILDSKKS